MTFVYRIVGLRGFANDAFLTMERVGGDVKQRLELSVPIEEAERMSLGQEVTLTVAT